MHLLPEGIATYPSGQRQTYVPGMLRQTPGPQMAGLASHSSMSKQRCSSSESRQPSAHVHTYEPNVLVHVPWEHKAGCCAHSSMSARVTTYDGCNQSHTMK